jgi:hypothetical protein
MKGIFVIIALLMLSSTSFSQTKRIAHRSHSGKNSTFTVNSIHNFGEYYERIPTKDTINKLKANSAKKSAADTVKKSNAPVRKLKTKKVYKPVTKTTR